MLHQTQLLASATNIRQSARKHSNATSTPSATSSTSALLVAAAIPAAAVAHDFIEEDEMNQKESEASVATHIAPKLFSKDNLHHSHTTVTRLPRPPAASVRVCTILTLLSDAISMDASDDGTLVAVAAGRSCQIWSSCCDSIGNSGGGANRKQPKEQLILIATLNASSAHHTKNTNSGNIKLVRFTPAISSASFTSASTSSPQYNLLTSYSDGSLALWDLQTKKVLRMFQGHREPVVDVTFARSSGGGSGVNAASTTPDLLFSCSSDGHVLLWDWLRSSSSSTSTSSTSLLPPSTTSSTSLLLGSYALSTSGIRSLSYLSSCSKLLCGLPTGEISIWDVRRHESVAKIQADREWTLTSHARCASNKAWLDEQRYHTGGILTVRVSQDESMLASGARDRTVKVWSLYGLRRDLASVIQTRERMIQQQSSDSSIGRIRHDHDSSLSSSEGREEQLPLDAGEYIPKLLHTLRHDDEVTQVEWIRQRQNSIARTAEVMYLVTGTASGAVNIWAIDTDSSVTSSNTDSESTSGARLVYQIHLPVQITSLALSYPLPHNPFITRLHISVSTKVIVLEVTLGSTNVSGESAISGTISQQQEQALNPSKHSSSSSTKKGNKGRYIVPSAFSLSSSPLTSPRRSPPSSSVTSDALLTQYLPGASGLLKSVAAASSVDAVAVVPSALNTASSFLASLLHSEHGFGLDAEKLYDNLTYFRLTPTHFLRLISSSSQSFSLRSLLSAFSTQRPECHALYNLVLNQMEFGEVLVEMGYARVRKDYGDAVQLKVQTDNQTDQEEEEKCDPSTAISPLPTKRLTKVPSKKVFEYIPSASGGSNMIRSRSRQGQGDGLATTSNNNTVNHTEEGFFFTPSQPDMTVPLSDSLAGRSVNATYDEELQQPIHWYPSTQLNLISLLTTPRNNTSSHDSLTTSHQQQQHHVASIHAETVLQKSHTKYPLFGVGQYGGGETSRGDAGMEQQQQQQQHSFSMSARTNRNPGAHPASSAFQSSRVRTSGVVHRGYSSTKSAAPSSSIDPLVSFASSALTSSAPRSLFATLVAGQIVPNGERIVRRKTTEKTRESSNETMQS